MSKQTQMIDPQAPQAPQPSEDWFDAYAASVAAMGWVDLTAIAVLLVFFVLGFFRGLVWQLSRIAILLIAYFAAITFGRDLAVITASWFDPLIETSLPLYLAVFMIFMGTLITVSIAAHFLQKLVESSGFTFANRFGGGLCGIATGGLVVLAMLTVIQMVNASYGIGSGVAYAARSSRSMAVGHDVLRSAERIAPQRWHPVMTRWLVLLGQDQENSAATDGQKNEQKKAGPNKRGENAGGPGDSLVPPGGGTQTTPPKRPRKMR